MTGAHYEIVVRGRLGEPAVRWFESLEVRASASGVTCLRGWFADQASIHGTLAQLNDIGIELASVQRLDDGSEPTS